MNGLTNLLHAEPESQADFAIMLNRAIGYDMPIGKGYSVCIAAIPAGEHYEKIKYEIS